jgi:16S rRNA (uracil1498-N3)-methyltransferase
MRADAPTVAAFFSPDPLASGALVTLGEEAAHHMRVRRLEVGDAVELRDGVGAFGRGRLVRLAKSHAVVELGAASTVERPPNVHLLAPVADRERTLWLAEKAMELGVASWRPVVWHRSKSVGPRGEGVGFHQKVRARMSSALIQCEAGWMPDILPDSTIERAMRALPEGTRLVLDPDGSPIEAIPLDGAAVIAVGPEGGLEPAELVELEGAGFRRLRLPGNILRFETAAVVGIALVRAALERTAHERDVPVPPRTPE